MDQASSEINKNQSIYSGLLTLAKEIKQLSQDKTVAPAVPEVAKVASAAMKVTPNETKQQEKKSSLEKIKDMFKPGHTPTKNPLLIFYRGTVI